MKYLRIRFIRRGDSFNARFQKSETSGFHLLVRSRPAEPSNSGEKEDEVPKQTGDDRLIEGSLKVSIFPNPSKKSFTFTIVGIVAESEIAISVEDINGHVIYSKNQASSSKSATLTWDAEKSEDGLYFYVITTADGQRAAGKLVKL